GALDPARAGQLQELIEAEVAQRLQAERLWLEAQIAAQLEVQIATRLEAQLAARLEAQISARLEAQLDSRVAHEVAQKVQQIIEQNRLARHRQFGPSSEAGQGWLFNEAELFASQPQPPADADAPTAP